MNRKDFVKTASLATILAMTGLTLESCSSDSEDTDPNNDNNNNGNDGNNGGGPANSVSFSIQDSPFDALLVDRGWVLHPTSDVLLINVGGTLSAFTSVCTHSGCSRDWEYSNELFTCTCHSSQFNTDGQVVSGPASSPLRKLTLTQSGNNVTVEL